MAKKKKQNVLTITVEEGSQEVRVDFSEGDLPLELVLVIMESIIESYRNKPSKKDIN